MSDVNRNIVSLHIWQQHNLEVLVTPYQHLLIFFERKCQCFLPNKPHLWEVLIYFFNLKKSAADAHRLLVEAYGEVALSERSCREWFQKFTIGEFNVDDKERSGRPKVYEDTELEALLMEDSCQTQDELVFILGVTQQAISHHLKSLGLIQNKEIGFHRSWKRETYAVFEMNVFHDMCEMLLARHKRKGFLHLIVTGDEKWIHYDNPKKRKSWRPPGHASTSTAKPNSHGKKLMLCIWWDQLGVVYYELLKPSETITGALYRTRLMRLSRTLKENRTQYTTRQNYSPTW